jgi:hypothetical protein
MKSSCCLCVCVYPHPVLIAWTYLYETGWVYHGAWAHPYDVLQKSFPSLCVPLSLLGNGSVNTFHRHRIHAAIEKLLDSLFPIWSMFSQRRICGSVCVSPVLVYVYLPPKRWSEGSQSHQTVIYGHESRGTRNQESLCWRRPQQFTGLAWPGLDCVSPYRC